MILLSPADGRWDGKHRKLADGKVSSVGEGSEIVKEERVPCVVVVDNVNGAFVQTDVEPGRRHIIIVIFTSYVAVFSVRGGDRREEVVTTRE